MVTTLINKFGMFICGSCRMVQPTLDNTCCFCGKTFSNYEEIVAQGWREDFEEQIKEDGN